MTETENALRATSDWAETTIQFKVQSNQDGLTYEIPIVVAHPNTDHGYLLGLQAMLGITPELVHQLAARLQSGEDIVDAEVVDDLIATDEPTA